MVIGTVCRFASLTTLSLIALSNLEKGKGVVLLIAVGIFQASWPLISVSVSDQLFRASSCGRGFAVGLLTFVGAAASASGAIIGGVIAGHVGYRGVIYVAAIILLLAVSEILSRNAKQRTRGPDRIPA